MEPRDERQGMIETTDLPIPRALQFSSALSGNRLQTDFSPPHGLARNYFLGLFHFAVTLFVQLSDTLRNVC